MSGSAFKSLSWLPAPPDDFTSRCRSVFDRAGLLGAHIRALASYALDGNQLHRLARIVSKARQCGYALEPLKPFKLGLLSNSTVDFILPALVASAARHGIALECITADFNQAVQHSFASDSAIHLAQPDAVLIAMDCRCLPPPAALGNSEAEEIAVAGGLEILRAIRSGIKRNTNALCIVQNMAPPVERLFGHFDRVLPGTLRRVVDGVNRGLADGIAGSGDVLFDVAGLAETVGLADWHSPVEWNVAKLAFSQTLLPLYAEHAARLIAAIRGAGRKCLVLDLDNTLWGGVIGDDGLEGIQIGEGDPAGEAYVSVQKLALALRGRGIVLAVSSKNQDETARLPFREHPDMPAARRAYRGVSSQLERQGYEPAGHCRRTFARLGSACVP